MSKTIRRRRFESEDSPRDEYKNFYGRQAFKRAAQLEYIEETDSDSSIDIDAQHAIVMGHTDGCIGGGDTPLGNRCYHRSPAIIP